MKKFSPLIFLLVCLSLLTVGMLRERHRVGSFKAVAATGVAGPEFVDGATWEKFVVKEGRLYDTTTLVPGKAQEKDCKT